VRTAYPFRFISLEITLFLIFTRLIVYFLAVPELQGEPEDISKEKARLAALQVHKLLAFSNLQIYYLN